MRRRPRFVLITCILAVGVGIAIAVMTRQEPVPTPPDAPTSEPDVPSLVGVYQSTDARMPRATIDLQPDKTFAFTGSAGERGFGKWHLDPDFVGCWQLILDYQGKSPEPSSAINRPLKGRTPPFTIMFFASAQDHEATVPFTKVASPK